MNLGEVGGRAALAATVGASPAQAVMHGPAVPTGHADIARRLLEAKANPNAPDGFRPGRFDVIELLEAAGALEPPCPAEL